MIPLLLQQRNLPINLASLLGHLLPILTLNPAIATAPTAGHASMFLTVMPNTTMVDVPFIQVFAQNADVLQ